MFRTMPRRAPRYEEWVRRRPLADYGVPRSSVTRGKRVREMLLRTFSGRSR
jgi:hypothetical protein